MHSKTGMKKLQWSFFYNTYEVKTNKTLELLKKDFICKKYLGAYCILLLSCYRKTAKGLFFIKLLCFSKTSPLSQTPLQNSSSISLERTYQILMHSKIGMKKLQWSFFYSTYEVKTNKTLNF